MNRPLTLFTISLILGIILAKTFGSMLFICFVILFYFIFVIIFKDKINKYKVYVILMAAMFMLGAFEYLFVNNTIVSKFDGYYGETAVFTGMVISEPQIKEDTVVYLVRVIKIDCSGVEQNINAKLSLSTLKKDNKIYSYGQVLSFTGSLNPVKGRRNPGGFDYRDYLAQSGISGVIFVKAENITKSDIKIGNMLVRLGLKLRNRIIDTIDKSLPQRHAGLLNGMLIGYKGGMDEDLKQAFSDSGISHIMAVSGANVAFIVLPLLFILKKAGLKKKTGNLITIGVLLVFTLVTGFEPSVLRAVIMAITMLIGATIYRDGDVYTSISFAALLMLLINPYTIFNIGFKLSYAATLSLVLFYNEVKKKFSFKVLPAFVADVLASTLAVQIGVLPVSLFYFNKISLISIFTNILVVPVTGIITIFGLIMAIMGQIIPLFSQLLGYINIVFLAFVIYISEFSAALPFAVITVVTPTFALLLSYYFLILFISWKKPPSKIKRLVTALVLVLFISVQLANMLLPRELEIVFLDIGQGDSFFIRTTTGKTILIDGGGKLQSTVTDSNPGETTVLPFLLDKEVYKVDIIIATHAHGDHIQGLFPVIDQIGADILLMPDVADEKEFRALIDFSKQRGINIEKCAKNDIIVLDERTYIEVLHPTANFEIDKSPLNNSSLVLKLVYKDTSILFTGDIEAYVEEMLLDENVNLKADVLKVAHHGSGGSSAEAFVKSVNAGVAVISVGKNNFGHPSDSSIERFEKLNTQIYRTDEQGAIILKSNGTKIKMQGFIR